VWAYVEGGMGAVSDAIAERARQKGMFSLLLNYFSGVGVFLMTDALVSDIHVKNGKAEGVGVIVNGEKHNFKAKQCVVCKLLNI